jgi:hypothetical protein
MSAEQSNIMNITLSKEEYPFDYSYFECQAYTPCKFGKLCYRMDGTFDRYTGDFDTSNKCNLFHQDKETIDQYHTRTGIVRPKKCNFLHQSKTGKKIIDHYHLRT